MQMFQTVTAVTVAVAESCCLCTNCLKIEWFRNALFAASRGGRRKCEAAFVVSRGYVTHCTEAEGVTIRCCLLFSG